MRLRVRPCSAFILAAAWLFPLVLSETSNRAAAQTTPAGELHIDGAVATPLTLTVADLKKMPRKSLTVDNLHTGKKETYVGVPVEELLRQAGVPQGETFVANLWQPTSSLRLRTVTEWCSPWQNSIPESPIPT